MQMKGIKKAERVIARLTAEDMRKLRNYIDECLLAAIKMKNSMQKFLGTLDRLEKEA
jgi:hypothetical protein